MTTVWRLLMDESTLPWVLTNGRIAIGWGEVGDIRQLGTLDAIAVAIRARNAEHPDFVGMPEANVQHGAHSLHDFCFAIRPGDLVILSDRSRRRGVWEVVGDYEYVDLAAVPADTNYQNQRVARLTDQNADELWFQSGGGLASRINYRTLDRCANAVE